MSRVTVSMMKGTGTCPTRAIPKIGSKRRALYDLLSPGEVVPTKAINSLGARTRDIYLFAISYDLDIRSIARGFWCRVGEWEDGKYIDHIANRLEAA